MKLLGKSKIKKYEKRKKQEKENKGGKSISEGIKIVPKKVLWPLRRVVLWLRL